MHKTGLRRGVSQFSNARCRRFPVKLVVSCTGPAWYLHVYTHEMDALEVRFPISLLMNSYIRSCVPQGALACIPDAPDESIAGQPNKSESVVGTHANLSSSSL